MRSVSGQGRQAWGSIAVLNRCYHQRVLLAFLAVAFAYWAEHAAQASQIWVLHWAQPESRGLLGIPFPWLVTSEWPHYVSPLVMLVGFWVLRPAFTGRSRMWWNTTLGMQIWHHFEHALLLWQVLTGLYLFGRPVPTSIAQLIVPGVELHLLYNAVVFIPMLIAMYLHMRCTAIQRAVRPGCRAVDVLAS